MGNRNVLRGYVWQQMETDWQKEVRKRENKWEQMCQGEKQEKRGRRHFEKQTHGIITKSKVTTEEMKWQSKYVMLLSSPQYTYNVITVWVGTMGIEADIQRNF